MCAFWTNEPPTGTELLAHAEMGLENLVAVYGTAGAKNPDLNKKGSAPSTWEDEGNDVMLGLNKKVSWAEPISGREKKKNA